MLCKNKIEIWFAKIKCFGGKSKQLLCSKTKSFGQTIVGKKNKN